MLPRTILLQPIIILGQFLIELMIILSINLSSQSWIKGKVEAAKLRELVEVTEQPASRAAIKELQAPSPAAGQAALSPGSVVGEQIH